MMRKLLPLLLFVAATLPAFAQTVSFSVPVVPCNNNGVLTANVTGLTPPLTVTWYTQGTTGTSIVQTTTGTTAALTSYSGGPVSVLVTDGVSFASNSFPGIHPINYTLTATGAVCPALGTISAVASGGTAPYTYKWYDKSNGSIITTANPASLPTGSYGVIVTDAAGCVYGSRVRNDGSPIVYTSFTATVTSTAANCTDGTASVAAIHPSAVLPISYRWSNGATTSSISGLSRGFYSVEITDALGCKATTDTAMPYNPYGAYVNQTTFISVPVGTTPATCTSSDGAVTAFPSGGTTPYSYVWSNGATTASQTGLTSGTYRVTVRDANGCIGEDTGLVASATPISVTFSSSPSLCTSPTGNASLTVMGGTPPYSILWYSSPMQTSTTATSLAAGTYNFRVTDALGCMRTGTVTVPPINTINVSITSTSPLCALSNGSLGVTPSGGAAPYTYLWSTGATTPTISSMPAGSYNVTVTDAMGCKVSRALGLTSFSPVNIGISNSIASCLFANDGTLTATPYGGTAPYSYGWSTGGTTATISALPSGMYYVNVTDATGCVASMSSFLGYDMAETSCYCTIEGTVYSDGNSNCVKDMGELGIPHTQVHCSGIGYTYTNSAGHYSFTVPAGTYTVTETMKSFYPLSPCQLNNIAVTAATGPGCVNTVDFANTPVPVHNMRISTSTMNPPVPGMNTHERITIINEGTLTESTAFAAYKPDGQLLAPWFTPSGIFTGSGYWYTTSSTFPTLEPGTNQSFVAKYSTPANIPLGTLISSRDTTAYNSASGAWLADHTPADNVCDHNTVVVSSYDPNYKEVTPRGTGANGIINATDSVLEYTVHFQNLGTWYAQNVVVIDTLDNDLNWTTLHPVYESAPCQVSLYQSGAVKVAKFTFNNINLPPQIWDDLRSNGMFTYTIRTNPGLAAGTQFRNRASIYFDYNEPIVTNTTINTIGGAAPPPTFADNGTTIESNSFVVYPNPANSSFSAVISNDKAGNAVMNVADVSGKSLIAKTFALQQGTQTINTDISQLAAGVYFVSINSNGNTQTQKLVVIR